MFRLVRIALGVAVVSFSSPLLAAEIRWSGEASCRRELEVVEQVESATGRPVSSVEIADFELNLKSSSTDQWNLELTTVRRADGARSTRAIHGATCAEVTDAAAVAIALAIGPGQAQAESEPKPAVGQSAAAAGEKPVAEAGKVSAQPKDEASGKQSALEWFAGLSGTLDSSSTPGLAVGAALHFGLGLLPSDKSKTQLRLELEGAFYAPTETNPVGGQAGKFQLMYGAPLVCAGKPLGGPLLLGCVGAEFGQLTGEGVGEAVTTSHQSQTFWSAARAELGLVVPLAASLRLLGRAGVAVPLIRRDFVLDGPEIVFRTAPLSARAGLGVELTL